MSVITISRGTFSGGKMLAECVAKKLGFRCLDRDVIVERAAGFGVSPEELLEALEKAPRFLDRFQHKKYIYLTLIQAALTEEVRHGQVVYHGHAGHLLLGGGRAILRVRIIAPMEFRIDMACKRLKLTRSEAIAYIARMDQERRKWAEFLYGLDWADPSLYDLVVNLEYVGIEQGADVVAGLAKKRCFRFTSECQARMDDLALASRIRAGLAINPSTSGLEVDVTVQNGQVRIKGKMPRLDQREEVERVTLQTPGVAGVAIEHLVKAAGH